MRRLADGTHWRPYRIAAGSAFVVLTICLLAGVGPVPLVGVGMAAAAGAVAWITSRMERERVMTLYALLARIGDGELGASLPDSLHEGTLRLQRGIARAQRGYAEAFARAEMERDDLQTLLSAIQTGLVALDGQLRVRSANEIAERMLGLQTTDYRGRLLAEVIRQPELLAFAERAAVSPEPIIAEIRLTGTGTESLMVAGEPLRGPSSGGVLLALDDVTRLRRLENVRADFAANVSHELRTPITSIKGYVETLLDVGATDPEQVRHFLGVIHRSTIRLSTLIEDILLLAFLDQPRVATHIDFAQMPLRSVVEDACSQVALMAQARSMTVHNSVPEDLHATVNASLLSQAVLNLLSNALKYSPEGTTVAISGDLVNGCAEIQVRDEGPGVADEHLPRLFERFYRVDAARSREAGGTGLGLAIVKHIAMVHGGSVSVDCPRNGGTVFTMRIPRGFRQLNGI